MKSPNITSIIGRRPVTAAPKAAPASASSEIGVSNTRVGPEALDQLSGDLEDAAGGGDVLAEEHDRRVALELLGDRLANRVPELERRSWPELGRRSLGAGSGYGAASGARATASSMQRARCRLGRRRPAPRRLRSLEQPRRREPERIALQPALDLVLRAVRGRIALGVAVVAVGAGTRAASARRPRAPARPPRVRAACTAHRSLPSTVAAGIVVGARAPGDVGPGGHARPSA